MYSSTGSAGTDRAGEVDPESRGASGRVVDVLDADDRIIHVLEGPASEESIRA